MKPLSDLKACYFNCTAFVETSNLKMLKQAWLLFFLSCHIFVFSKGIITVYLMKTLSLKICCYM